MSQRIKKINTEHRIHQMEVLLKHAQKVAGINQDKGLGLTFLMLTNYVASNGLRSDIYQVDMVRGLNGCSIIIRYRDEPVSCEIEEINVEELEPVI